MNIHGTSKKGCEQIVSYFEEFCQKSLFFIQVMEILDISGYD